HEKFDLLAFNLGFERPLVCRALLVARKCGRHHVCGHSVHRLATIRAAFGSVPQLSTAEALHRPLLRAHLDPMPLLLAIETLSLFGPSSAGLIIINCTAEARRAPRPTNRHLGYLV